MLSDQQLVQRTLVLGDRSAYGELVGRHQAQLRAFLLRHTRNRELADDLAQESFLQGFRKLTSITDGAKFRAWIFSIAHNEFLQWLRAQRPVSYEAPEPPSMAVTAKTELESLLKTLRPEERSALILCLGHDFSHSEASEILELPVGTIKSLILRARQKLGAKHD